MFNVRVQVASFPQPNRYTLATGPQNNNESSRFYRGPNLGLVLPHVTDWRDWKLLALHVPGLQEVTS